MVLWNYRIYLGQQHERGCTRASRKAKCIEAVLEKNWRGAIGEAATGNFHDTIVRCDQDHCGGRPLAGDVGSYPASQTSADQAHAIWVPTRLRADPVIKSECIGQDSTSGRTPLRGAVTPVVEK